MQDIITSEDYVKAVIQKIHIRVSKQVALYKHCVYSNTCALRHRNRANIKDEHLHKLVDELVNT